MALITTNNHPLTSSCGRRNRHTGSFIDDFFNDFDTFFNVTFPDFPNKSLIDWYEGFPVTNVYVDKQGNWKIEVAVTGFSKDEISVSVENGSIVVETMHKEDSKKDSKDSGVDDNDWKIVHRRLKKEAFFKRFKLPGNLDAGKTNVDSLENGVLTLTVPIAEESKPKRLEIK